MNIDSCATQNTNESIQVGVSFYTPTQNNALPVSNEMLKSDCLNTQGHAMTKNRSEGTKAKRTPREGIPNIIHTPQELAKQGHRHPELFGTKDPKELFAVAMQAQRVLPMARRRSRKSLYSSIVTSPQFYKGTLDKMKEAMLAHPATVQLPKESKPGGKTGQPIVRWKGFENALIAWDARVLPLIDKPDYEPPNERLIDAVMQAQLWQLPAERQRTRVGLMQGIYNRRLLPSLRETLKHGPPLDLKIYDPNPPAIEPEPEPIEAAPAAPVAPPEITLADAFGVILKALGPAIRRTLVDVAREVAREVLAAPHASAAPSVDTIAQAVKSAVYDVVGGPAPQPASPEAPAPPERAAIEREADAIAERLLRVDVVGLNGPNASVVRQRMGNKFDLRFLDPEQAMRQDVTAPVAIVCRRFISHAAEKRINTDRIIYADGAAPSVVRHLQSLMQ